MPHRIPPAPPIFTVRVRLPGFVDQDGTKVDAVWRFGVKLLQTTDALSPDAA